MGHLLAHMLGIDNEAGRFYAFWSGFGSDIGELALIGAVLGMFRKHNCHSPGCWRIGRHLVNGSPWCNKHHEAQRQGTRQPAGFPSRGETEMNLTSIFSVLHTLAERVNFTDMERSIMHDAIDALDPAKPVPAPEPVAAVPPQIVPSNVPGDAPSTPAVSPTPVAGDMYASAETLPANVNPPA